MTPHAKEMSEAQWLAILQKVQFGSELFPVKKQDKPQPVDARTLSPDEWQRALEKITMGRI